ncbi:MAG: single-stranded-DNA-specific exonuclease RecJ, partial [Firmicutes bacterium]|nr:single-stranded-DNA-specific exonuclease RecJ [Bacillota bacterium]
MSANSWSWFVPKTDPQTIDKLMAELGIHRLTATTLSQRGLHTSQDARRFLACDLADLGDPFSMAGATIAAERLARAVQRREPVLIFGDYDVDGVTSTALLTRTLQNLNVPVTYYIPSRFADGYGLQGAVLEKFAATGGQLVITVDCGVNSFAEMELAQSLGLDLIITDHHTCFPGIRRATAVLNPKQAECMYPEKRLAGVGVAWTLVRALYTLLKLPQDAAYDYLDLVAVGTIADVVPLVGENRILVKHGLERLRQHPSPGLAALARVSGLPDTNMTAMQVAFTLAPRLNAAGRLGTADPAVATLLSGLAEADTLATALDAQNRKRQQIEKEITIEARAMVAEQLTAPALVLWQAGWNPGVIGIVAGRLASEFERPVVLIAVDGNEGHGSIRSVPGCNVVEALQACADHLERFGGHAEAAGLTVATDQLEVFRTSFCQAVATQEAGELLQPVVAEVQLSELDLALVHDLEVLAPFGHGHAVPLFLVQNADVVTTKCVGARGDHLRLSLRQAGRTQAAIHFGGGSLDVNRGDTVDVVVAPSANVWQGRTSLSLQVKDLRIATCELVPTIIDRRGFADREQYIARLAAEQKLAIWVNTNAAKVGLETLLPTRTQITQLGRNVDFSRQYDGLILYHLPYQRD